MKNKIIIIFILFMIVFGVCFLLANTKSESRSDSQKNAWSKIILDQINNSQGKLTIVKKVTQAETIEIRKYESGKNDLQLKDELQYAYKLSATDKSITNHYALTINRDVNASEHAFEYSLNSEHDSKSKLKYQKIVTSRDNIVRYTESVIRSESWLYNSQIHIRLWFDSSGVYLKHNFVYQNSLFGNQMNYKVNIEGYKE